MESTPPNVVLGIVARGRPMMLQRLIASALVNSGRAKIGIFVLFDDDPNGLKAAQPYPFAKYLNNGTRLYYVRTANRLARYIVASHPCDYFAIVDDDTEFIQLGWAEALAQFFEGHFPDGYGIVDMLSVHECCHIFTTPKFFEDKLKKQLYDPRYMQFFHDTVLCRTAKENGWFAHLNDIDGRPIFVHHRDFGGGAAMSLIDIKQEDSIVFHQQAAERGWPLQNEGVDTNLLGYSRRIAQGA